MEFLSPASYNPILYSLNFYPTHFPDPYSTLMSFYVLAVVEKRCKEHDYNYAQHKIKKWSFLYHNGLKLQLTGHGVQVKSVSGYAKLICVKLEIYRKR